MPPKYIAAGFLYDAEKLLKDFIAENSVEFKAFSSMWRKHYFSLIYMGRQNERELSEFTSEIFRISLPFLYPELPFLQNVGGVFLLYGLFRSQILNPPIKIAQQYEIYFFVFNCQKYSQGLSEESHLFELVLPQLVLVFLHLQKEIATDCLNHQVLAVPKKIRVLPSDFRNFLRIRHTAVAEKYRSLHYVLDYMITNSFDFVAAATLLGPKAVKVPSMKKSNEKISTLEESTQLAESELLKTINDLSKEIEELSETIPISVASFSHEELSETVNHLNTLVKTGFCSNNTQNSVKSSVSKDIGSRRAQIKAAAFEQQATYYLRNISGKSDPDDQDNDQKNTDENFSNSPKKTPKKTMRHKARVPKHLRKVGRPKNIPDQESDNKPESDSESNDESFLNLATDLLPSAFASEKKKREKPRRKFYYDE